MGHAPDNNTYLLVFRAEGATEMELQGWNQIKATEALNDCLFLELIDRQQYELEHERLVQEGWALMSTGSGWLSRCACYKKPLAE